ncbi:hypothetical protein FIBSPDRAFT_859615 [Athelia psychrophila]|uniref:Uncharacterized protein n=1 Tax=Athelia psychrophila TaxID=1759441 RepID=A0A166KWB7_9AGAM|nr:hypothetical protein FIBSPDRAFT_859615 [Fibularhizoctonia sp. CBS 109695]
MSVAERKQHSYASQYGISRMSDWRRLGGFNLQPSWLNSWLVANQPSNQVGACGPGRRLRKARIGTFLQVSSAIGVYGWLYWRGWDTNPLVLSLRRGFCSDS